MPDALADAAACVNRRDNTASQDRWNDWFDDMLRRVAASPTAYPKSYEDRYFEETLRDAYFGTPKRQRHRVITLARGDTVYILRVRAPRQDVLRSDQITLPPA